MNHRTLGQLSVSAMDPGRLAAAFSRGAVLGERS